MQCPKCGSKEVRRSRRGSLREYILSLFLVLPYRCRHCMHRFRSAEEGIRKLRFAHCPHCGNFDLEKISSRHVPVRWFKSLQRRTRHRAYRCDRCRWRFFDFRPLAPQLASREQAETPAAERDRPETARENTGNPLKTA